MIKNIIVGCSLWCAVSAASAVEVITNGNFEAGDLSGWSTSGGGTTGSCPSENRTWVVSDNGTATGCSNPGDPADGTYAAYNMFDGGNPSAPVTYQLWQSVSVPTIVTAATLNWSQAVTASFSDAPRVFAIEFTNAAGDTILQTVRSTDYTGSDNTGWTNEVENVTAALTALGGQTVNLRFSVYISENWTGGAGMGLDVVSLDITGTDAVVAATPVPTMSAYGLVLTMVGLLVVAARRLRTSAKRK